MASTLRSLRSGSALVGIVDSEEGRTHMMREHRSLIVWPSLIAAGLLAAACTDQPNVSMAPNRPNFWLTPPPAVCTGGKWTGGGRIDPAYPDPRAGSNYDGADEDLAHEEEYFAYTLPNMTGKVTFGFNIFLAVNSETPSRCYVQKGEIEVNHHPAKTSWHVSIHDGTDAQGNTVYASVFADASGRGYCLVVGIPDNYMWARVNGNKGYELTQFEVCDNDRGQPQNSRHDAMRWRAAGDVSHDPGDTHLIYLTGGNIVEHGS